MMQYREAAPFLAAEFSHYAFLRPGGFSGFPYGPFSEVLALGAKSVYAPAAEHFFTGFSEYAQGKRLFGYISYEMGEVIESLGGEPLPALIDAPPAVFFEPKHLVFFRDPEPPRIVSDNPKKIMRLLQHYRKATKATEDHKPRFETLLAKEKYLATAQHILKDIGRGDYYELNYCGFEASGDPFEPAELFNLLCRHNPAPFAAMARFNRLYILSASPERFLKKLGTKIVTQPMKGTASRFALVEQDLQARERLRNDPKERAENAMITDLCRNDLSRIGDKVRVAEFCGVYGFSEVWQMISTIAADIKKDKNLSDLIKALFPPGSMTGAPKISVMNAIRRYEDFRRGPYAGCLGYITPQGDFDFNVLIRSLIYDAQTGRSAYGAGGALTHKSIPENERIERLLKCRTLTHIQSND